MATSVSRRHALPAWLRLLRPLQWSKNLVVFAGLVFGGRMTEWSAVGNATLTFVAFCMVSSSMYVFNDWHDREEDRLHPVKRLRPIASGELSADYALGLGIALLGLALVLAAQVSVSVAVVVLGYALLMLTYTLRFRERAFLDVGVIAAGFVLRALAGTIAVSVTISVWLFICTLLLALLLGVCKRQQEVVAVQRGLDLRRPTLKAYQSLPLDKIIVVLAVLTFLAYTMYAIAANRDEGLPLWISIPFVGLAVVRYMYLVLAKGEQRSPELLLVSDAQLAACVCCWGLSIGAVLMS